MPDLPTGTVTFLFTDIEGSTRLLRTIGDRYAEVLQAHYQFLRESVTKHGGGVLGTEGDAVFASFPTARDALAAAVESQRLLATHSWPDNIPLRIRMGVHTGEPLKSEIGYVGIDLHRAARIAAAAHGGQILISEATRALVQDDLPAETTLRDLGEHRLKDLARAERLFQVTIADLPNTFPPLKTLDALPHNLPVQLTSFIGREKEMTQIRQLLETSRLLALVGPGGGGKTRLAIQSAAEVLEGFKDGVWFVELGPLSDPKVVPQVTASVLGIREPARAALEALLDSVRARRTLIIFDNCEHVLDGCAELARNLLHSAPRLQIMATSREPLSVPGEVTYRVLPLSLPTPWQQLPPLQELSKFESIRLFIERATAAQSTFMLTEGNAKSVTEICWRLDGIPLAIELAAARIRVLSPEQIAARLNNRFRLLSGGSRTALAHHRTLQAALDWSHDLLGPTEKILLRRLSVFSGWFPLEAVESICSDDEVAEEDVLDLLTSLVDKSLVIVEQERGEARYRLLETVREYSRDKLVEAGEAVDRRNRHLQWYASLAERAEPELQGPRQEMWLGRLEAEHDNVRGALEWGMTEEGDAESALRLAAAIRWFWEVRGYWREGRNWLEQIVVRAGATAPSLLRARALQGIGLIALRQGDINRVVQVGEESLALVSGVGDKQGRAASLTILGLYSCATRDFGRAEALGGESLALCREMGHKWGIAASLHMLALVARYRGELDRADAFFEEEMKLSRELGDRWVMAQALRDQGLVARDRGDYERAEKLTQESLKLLRELGDKVDTAGGLSNLGILAWVQNQHEKAAALFKESLTLRKELDDKPGIAVCLLGLGVVSQSIGEHERATRLFGAAEGLRKALGAQLPPFIRDRYDSHVNDLRASVGEPTFTTAWTEGHAMTLEQAVKYTLDDTQAK
ncbi:MAG: tetratricopeptide repeat protein [bacterium]